MKTLRPLAVVLMVIAHAAEASADDRLRVEFAAKVGPDVMQANEESRFLVTIRNAGTLTWNEAAHVRLSYHWATSETARDDPAVASSPGIAERDGLRTTLWRSVGPGRELQVCAAVKAPPSGGTYFLQWDMVQEGVTWFSWADPRNLEVQRIDIRPVRPVPPPSRAAVGRERLKLAVTLAFLLGTFGHFALIVLWLRRRARKEPPERVLFHAAVFSAGSLYAVLHLLAFASSLTLAGGLGIITALHVAIAVWQRNGKGRPPEQAAGVIATSNRPSWLALAGIVVLVALTLQWFAVSIESARVSGTDAAHYHVPHAINFALEASPFGFIASPHPYPMGTSVLAAWLIKPFDTPLLLELATLPAFLLLAGAFLWLFRLVTGEGAGAWVPWLLLIVLAMPLVRVSLLMSADLPYAAAFIAFYTQLFDIWRSRRVGPAEIMAAALASGMLLGAKVTGTVSFAAMVAVFGAALGIERLAGRRFDVPRRIWIWVGAAVLSTVLAGGIWLARNWLNFGSPIAPSGLTLFGTVIFDGPPYSETKTYLSVLEDWRDIEDYDLGGRFAFHADRQLGPLFRPAALLFGLLLLDLGWQLARRRTLAEVSVSKLVLVVTAVILSAVHIALLIRAPWTSLEWTRGLSLRYILPLLLLYSFMCYTFVFPYVGAWYRHGRPRAIGGASLAAAAMWFFLAHQETPGMPRREWFPIIEPTFLLVAAAIVLASHALTRLGWTRTAAAVTAAAIIVLLAAFARSAVANNRQLVARASQSSRLDAECVRLGFQGMNEYRGIYGAVLAYERARDLSCGTRRFFLVSRFDSPIELQDPTYRNQVFDVRGRNLVGRALEQAPPGSSACDYVIGNAVDTSGARGARTLANLTITTGVEAAGRYGRYRAFHVRRR